MINDPMMGHLSEVMRMFLSDQCFIQRPIETTSAAGLPVKTWATFSPIRCRLLPLKQRSNEGVIAEREANKSQMRLILPLDADVQNGDRARIGETTYEIVEIKQGETVAMFMECTVSKIDD